MKKIMNSVESMVSEMCNGIALAHSDIEFNQKYKILMKKEINKNKVSILSGGGSGHEPAHAGFIGKGMLDGAVCGDVFASPSQIQVYQAIKETASNKGTLLIIKNYSGDMMNFKNAAFFAQEDGIEVEYVRVNDDIAVQNSLYTVGRRGVAGTIFVHKIAGAAAEKGFSLQEVKAVAEKTNNCTRTIGFAYTSCTVPANGTPTFKLEDEEMEYGVGIHGEPGISKEKIVSASELSKKMVVALLSDFGEKEQIKEIALLVNGFGATPLMELYLLNNSVRHELDQHNVKVVKTFVGNYMTSIDMAGASITILKLDKELKELLSEDCSTPSLKVFGAMQPVEYREIKSTDYKTTVSYKCETSQKHARLADDILTLENFIYIIDKMSECIIENEILFCDLDSHAGDSDFGMSLAKGFRQLKNEWKEILGTPSQTIGGFLDSCSLIIMEYCGGASGPIWGSAFRAAARQVGPKTQLTVTEFSQMLQGSVEGIQATGERAFGRGAVLGDKTLIDALIPCVDEWATCAKEGTSFTNAFKQGAAAAVIGAKKTEKIAALMGRAGTVGDRSIGYPDAGAHALGLIFTEISKSLE
jgi:triose/dihydroxyacetone kinase / FAD-AMP lyase (cyclizing)